VAKIEQVIEEALSPPPLVAGNGETRGESEAS